MPGVDEDPPKKPVASGQRDGIDADDDAPDDERSPREIAEDLEFDDAEAAADEQPEEVPDGDEPDFEDDPDQVDGAADADDADADEIDFDAEFEVIYGQAEPPARKTVAGAPPAGDDVDDVGIDEIAEAADLGEEGEDDDIPLTRGELRAAAKKAKAKRQELAQVRIRETVTSKINSRINLELDRYTIADDVFRRQGMFGAVWSHLNRIRRQWNDDDLAKVVRLVAEQAKRHKSKEGTQTTQRERNRVAAPSPREARPGKTTQGKPKRSTDGKAELDLTDTRSTDRWMKENFRD